MSRSIYQLSQKEPITELRIVGKTKHGKATHAFSTWDYSGRKKNWSLCQRELVTKYRDEEEGHPGWDAIWSKLTCYHCQHIARRTKIYVAGRDF